MTDFSPLDPKILAEIKALLGKNGYRDSADAKRYFDDPRGRFHGQASLIALPATTDQVAALVWLCNAARIGIIPYSGGTGVVAGQLSIDSGNVIILSLERMNRIREISTDEYTITAEAGCILENIQAAAAETGMMFPLSMASKGSCCIGGNLATNAGGIQVLRYGNTRDLCLGIEAVLPSGDILNELVPLRKNNTGYDLRHLLIGSEGTLGIITAATLRLSPVEPETVTFFGALKSPADALALYRRLRRDIGEQVSALELMSGFGVDLVTAHFDTLRNPLAGKHPWYLLGEASGQAGMRERVEDALAAAMEAGAMADAVLAESDAQRQGLWDLRENTPEANRANGAFCNSDTAVPISRVDAFITRTTEAILAVHPDLRINSYGHIGDGNIHHNVFPPAGISKAGFLAANPEMVEAVRMAINEATCQCGGAISAEHGIGRLKLADMQAYVSATRRDTMRRIKAAIDPNNIMNPGALIG